MNSSEAQGRNQITYRERYNEEPTFHSVEAFVAIMVMAEAVKRAPAVDSESIRKSLLELDMDTAYSHVKFETFQDFTNQNRHPMVIQQIQKGKFVLLWPDDYKTGAPLYPAPLWKKRAKP